MRIISSQIWHKLANLQILNLTDHIPIVDFAVLYDIGRYVFFSFFILFVVIIWDLILKANGSFCCSTEHINECIFWPMATRTPNADDHRNDNCSDAKKEADSHWMAATKDVLIDGILSYVCSLSDLEIWFMQQNMVQKEHIRTRAIQFLGVFGEFIQKLSKAINQPPDVIHQYILNSHDSTFCTASRQLNFFNFLMPHWNNENEGKAIGEYSRYIAEGIRTMKETQDETQPQSLFIVATEEHTRPSLRTNRMRNPQMLWNGLHGGLKKTWACTVTAE